MEIAYEQIAMIFFAITLLLIGVGIVEKVSGSAEVKTAKGGGGMCYFSSAGAAEIKAVERAEGDCVYNTTSKGFSIFDFENAVVKEDCAPIEGIIVMEKNVFAEGENITIRKTSDGLVVCSRE
ncbi:MAG: hypothetical protein ACPL06_02635 [Candidatus Anstonellales archaeon]